MRLKLIAILGLFACFQGNSQHSDETRYLTFDYQLVVDNDVFTLDMSQDQYYSSGIYPAVRWLADSSGNTKRILKAQLNHRIFTPSWVGWENQSQLDRPYAGQISVTLGLEHYFPSYHYLNTQLELGWMGPGSKVGEMQEIWHRWFGLPQPKGWKYQINDTPIINAYATYIAPLFFADKIDISSESNLALGTVFNHLRQEFLVRLGKLKPISHSAYTRSSLGNKREKSSTKSSTVESYFFYSPGVEYVFYNATIEGNFIGDTSIYTEKAYRWVMQHRAGVMFSWPRFDLGIIAYWRSIENTNATAHDYVGIRLNQRF